MDQGRGLKSLARLFVGEPRSGEFAKLVVDQWQSRSAAAGSPCSISDKICVTLVMRSGALDRLASPHDCNLDVRE